MTVGVVAPAGPVRAPEVLERGIANLERLGFRVKPGKFVLSRYGYLAGHDKDRAADLQRMFADKRVDGIISIRGGYGTGRLMPYLDFDVIRRNPKVLVGFSDLTYLQLAIWRRTRLVTFNGPMVLFTFGDEQPVDFTVEGLLRTVGEDQAAGSIWKGHPDREYRVITKGAAEGRLTGGNLSLVAATIGTPDEIETKGRIVVLEEIEEQPYRMDRMLTQLLEAGKLQQAAGVVIGRNVPHADTEELEHAATAAGRPKVMPAPARSVAADYEPTMDDMLNDRLRGLGIPVISGLPFGHIKLHATLPIGVRARMDSRTGELEILESAVR